MQYGQSQWLLFFFTYSVLGWIRESLYVSTKERQWINRGFLYGPWLPIYGFGAIIILFLTLPVRKNLIWIFLLGMTGATVLEYVTGYGKGVKYSAFIDGDNPYTFIRNRALADGSSCIIVKESFGNAIIPFLADHYQRIYVIDYRYWDGSLISFAEEKSVDDVIIINNISMTRNSYQVGKMALLVED